jgi:pantoate kinase
MEAIRKRPDLLTFLQEARKFGEGSGFQTKAVVGLIGAMVSAGAIGAAQNMIGEAVHGVAEDSRIPRILKTVRKGFPAARVFVSQLDRRGVRLA